MVISIEPTETEYVNIIHSDWHLGWKIQFPEMISIADGVLKHFSTIRPEWQKTPKGGWFYQWRPDAAYAEQKQVIVYKKDGEPIYQMLTGLALQAEITPAEGGVCLSLALSNKSDKTARMVSCEGGCFRPTNPEFSGKDYVARSYVRRNGRMMKLSELDRNLEQRCAFWHDPAGYERPIEKKCEDFWGRSKDRIDAPAIVGMVSADGSKAVALGYQGSQSALGGKLCLHSRPEFGDIKPGATVVRKGFIVFGDKVESLAEQVRRLLS